MTEQTKLLRVPPGKGQTLLYECVMVALVHRIAAPGKDAGDSSLGHLRLGRQDRNHLRAYGLRMLFAAEDCVTAVIENLIANKIIPTIKSKVP